VRVEYVKSIRVGRAGSTRIATKRWSGAPPLARPSRCAFTLQRFHEFPRSIFTHHAELLHKFPAPHLGTLSPAIA
jgi:hypothetical protein